MLFTRTAARFPAGNPITFRSGVLNSISYLQPGPLNPTAHASIPPIMTFKLATSCSLTFLPSGFYCEPSPIIIASSLNLLLPLVYVDVEKKKNLLL